MHVDDSELRTFTFDFITACFSRLREQGLLPRVPGKYLIPGRDYYYATFSELPEYQVLYDYLAGDERIREIYEVIEGTLVGSAVREYLIGLFRRILEESDTDLPTDIFNSWFNKFRKEIFRETVTIKTLWFLENFACSERRFVLDDQIEVCYFEDGSIQNSLGSEVAPWSYWKLGQLSGHALIATQTVDKHNLPGAYVEEQILRKLSSIVTALRLFKGGFINVRYSLILEISEFRLESPFVVEHEGKRRGFVPEYKMGSSEIDAFRNFWKELDYLYSGETDTTDTKNKLRLAIAYFESSYEKNWYEVLVNLALIATNMPSTAETDRDIGIIYDLRSKVVHGKTMSDMEFKAKLGELIGVPGANLDFREGLRAIEKATEYVRKVSRALIRLALYGQIKLNGQFVTRLDHLERNPNAKQQLQRQAGVIS